MGEYATHDIKVESLRRLVEKCSKAGIATDKEKLIGYCGRKWGTVRQSAQGYLKELESRELIKVDNNDVWTWIRWEKIKIAREKDYLKMLDIINKNG